MKIESLFIIAISFTLISCSSTSKYQNPTVQATLWVQNSAEFNALSYQAYQTASTKLMAAIEDKSWTSSLTQIGKEIEPLPTAIILDIDETVLDNSPFQARMIKKNSSFNSADWDEWCNEANASAILGAVEFTQKAEEMGVQIFYVSNRSATTEAATRQNLINLGFPVSDSFDNILTVGEQPNWTSSKIERRRFIEEKYRVIMSFGDDLNDFLPAKDITQEKRLELVKDHSSFFGTRWFVFPNPIYGSWDQALYGFNYDYTLEKRVEIINSNLKEKRN